MNKLILIAVATIAMVGISNAQSCGDNSTYGTQGPCSSGSVCGCQSGRSDCAGPSCVNLQTNNNNCGSLGNSCNVGGGSTCQRGECTCGDACIAGDFGTIQPSAPPDDDPEPPFATRLRLIDKHDDVAISVSMFRRKR